MWTWLRTPYRYGAMRGFQRRVWWPKWTPASRSWRSVNSGIAMGAGPFKSSGCASAGVALRHRTRQGMPAGKGAPRVNYRCRGAAGGPDMAEVRAFRKGGTGMAWGARTKGSGGGCELTQIEVWLRDDLPGRFAGRVLGSEPDCATRAGWSADGCDACATRVVW